MTTTEPAPINIPQRMTNAGQTDLRGGAFLKLLRFGLTVGGPIVVAGANFLVSLLLIPAVSPATFGVYSFGMVLLQVAMGVSDGLLGAPLAVHAARDASRSHKTRLHFHKVGVLLVVAASLVIAMSLAVLHTLGAAMLFGLYSGAMLMRWYGRANAFVDDQPLRVGVSDIAYAVTLLGLVGMLFVAGSISFTAVIGCLVAAAVVGLFALGTVALRAQILDARAGSTSDFIPVWKEKAGWSLTGILVNAATIESHVFVATILGGPATFAPIALAALFFRPTLVAVYALAQRERPLLANLIEAGEKAAAVRMSRNNQFLSLALWAGNSIVAVILSRTILHSYLPEGYDLETVELCILAFAAVMVSRTIRMPWVVFVQASNGFRSLAGVTALTAPVSVGLAALGLWFSGPVGCVVGMLAADLLLTSLVARLFFISGR